MDDKTKLNYLPYVENKINLAGIVTATNVRTVNIPMQNNGKITYADALCGKNKSVDVKETNVHVKQRRSENVTRVSK